MRVPIACLGITIFFSLLPAGAQEIFSFNRSIAAIDFSETDAEEKFQSIVEEAVKNSFVYLDWHLSNFPRNEVFQIGRNALRDRRRSVDPCGLFEDSRSRDILLSGRPNRDFNHLLLEMRLKPRSDDPFLIVGCEYFASNPQSEALRIRGFFFVSDRRIATAEFYNMTPVKVEPSRIPKNFFRHD
jgi:hypothetical protein